MSSGSLLISIDEASNNWVKGLEGLECYKAGEWEVEGWISCLCGKYKAEQKTPNNLNVFLIRKKQGSNMTII